MRARIAWAVVGLTTVAFILDTWFTAAHHSLLSEETWADHGWPLSSLAGLGYAVMGALIISRYPRHRLGWLLSAASLLSVTLATDAYSTWVLDGDGPGSAYWAHVAAWAGPLLGWPAFTAQIIVFLTAPDGHLLSPRWRWAAWVALAGVTLHTLGTLTIRPGEVVVGEDFGNRAVSLPLLTVGWMLVAAALDRLGRVLGAAAAEGEGRRAAAAPLDRVGRRVARARSRVHPRHPSHPGRGGDLVGGPSAAGRAGRSARVRGRRRAAAPTGRDRPDRQPCRAVRAGHGCRGGRLRGGRRPRRTRRRRQHRGLLALAARHRRRGAGVPARPAPGGQGRRPARLRCRCRAVRGAGRVQPPAGGHLRPHHPVAGRGRSGGPGRQRAASRGDAPRRGRGRPGRRLAGSMETLG